MDINHRLAISYYKTIAVINEPHHIYLVQHQETKNIAIKKVLDIYNIDVYNYLYNNHITGTPKIINYYEEDNKLTVIEEYISGVSLQDKINNTEISISDLYSYMHDLCNILKQLHSCNPAIIHRDIKPSNIIITSYNKAVLLDFNAAKYYSTEKNVDTILLGTQGYAAPEQYGFGQSSAQTDIYSLGIILKEIADVSDCHTASIDNVIAKSTQMNPSERYKNINELQEALLSTNEIPDKTSLNLKGNRNYTKYIPPGFRSKTPWKILLAAISYIAIIWLSLSMKVKDTYGVSLWIERVTALVMLLLIIASAFNYLNIQKLMPLCNYEKKSIHILGIILLDVIIVFGLVIIMTIIESFCTSV